jgi:hypothetical protein
MAQVKDPHCKLVTEGCSCTKEETIDDAITDVHSFPPFKLFTAVTFHVLAIDWMRLSRCSYDDAVAFSVLSTTFGTNDICGIIDKSRSIWENVCDRLG